MTETSGKAKIQIILNHLENVEILLGGLPKKITPNGKREIVRSLIKKVSDLQQEVQEVFKTDLE